MQLPTVAVVGRPNVGKSALFNRLTGTRDALVHDMPGVTRDRIYGEVEWADRRFQLIDTGGIVPEAGTEIEEHVKTQVALALDEAALVLFVVDGIAGRTPIDEEIALELRKKGLTVVLVVNKVDGTEHENLGGDFRKLGFKKVLAVSAAHGYGTERLLDAVVEALPAAEAGEAEAAAPLKVAFIGRPNVGKSSLINHLVETDRLIVSPEAGTTREAIEVPFRSGGAGRDMVLIDTAGLRRKARVAPGIEKLMRVTTERAIRKADVVVLLLDASEPLSHQDKHIAGLIREAKKPCLLVLNKLDLLAELEGGKPGATTRWMQSLEAQVPWFAFAPRVPLSALTGEGVARLLAELEALVARFEYRIPTPRLNKLVREACILHPPPIHRGRSLKVLYAVQRPGRPASFTFKVNDPEAVHFSFRRYLENLLRKVGDYAGFPIVMDFEDHGGARRSAAAALEEEPGARPRRGAAP